MKRIFLLLFLPILAFCDEDLAAKNSEFFGILTLIPPLVAIVLAFITKDVIFSLLLGVLSGTFMISVSENGIFSSFIKAFTDLCARVIGSMADSWNAGILLQVLCIGGLIGLITKMGGTKALAIWLSQRAKTPLLSQISTWFMGIVIFFDDYANALIVGPIMKPVIDKFKVSRAKLAFIIDATAAPITGLAIISTWIGLEISLIKSSYEIIGITDINAFAVFIETIPYRFYNIFMLFFVLCTALMSREFGPMYKAEMAARSGEIHKQHFTISNLDSQTFTPKEGIVLRKRNALVPILVMILASFVGFYFNGLATLEGETLEAVKAAPLSFMALRETFGGADASVVLFEAALFSSLVAIIMGISQKIYGVKEGIEIWVGGWKTMIITVVILLLAWSLSSVIKDLGTAKYLVETLSDTTPKVLLPILIFILGSFISFSTGTSFGTMGILMPLAIPLAHAVGTHYGLDGNELHAYMCVNISGVLTGAIFGDHCSPISDTTILSSMGAGCDHIEHVSTQFIYALSVGAITILLGYLPVALGLSVWLSLLLGMIGVVLLLKVVGKKVD
ncbi:MAG: Na+/H+ antiporter NhaC family protein [Campylobacter sp.]|nr:Na+/H+ antiporter NhaC family protein [Campylobacter sp.]